MRFVHMADLHLGKRVNDFPMIADQRFIMAKITDLIREEAPEAAVIAGDIYDKPSPPAEAVALFDDFISGLESMGIEVFIVSGNHDSADRLSFGSRIMDKRGIHFAGGYDGSTRKFTLEDKYGNVNFYLLPFLKPAHVRAAFADDEEAAGIRTFNEAVAYAVKRMDVDRSERNVLIAHQFCTGASQCDSEEISVGGLDNVDAEVFSPFDYTALGHLHGPQDIVESRVRYCGSPLKYSFSEADHIKSLTFVELGPKEDSCAPVLKTAALEPERDMKVLRGRFEELTDNYYSSKICTDDYMRVILTDEEEIIGALAGLRAVYPNIMRLEYDNTRSRAASFMPDPAANDARSPLEIFEELYESQNGRSMDEEQKAVMSVLIDKVWSERQ